MKKRRGRQVQFNLSVGEDPSLWRFSSLQDALLANTGVISGLIKQGEQLRSNKKPETDEVKVIAEQA